MEIIDYFGLWEHDRSCDPQRRTLEEEREFWRCYARVYDQHAGETGGSLAQIAAVTKRRKEREKRKTEKQKNRVEKEKHR